jgi:PIN domain nuclease of toxin-antitoxin system
MRFLLDTHALAWWVLDDPRLSRQVREIVSDTDKEVLVSAVSAFEMATKHRLGKWNDVGAFVEVFESAVATEGFGLLSISPAHARVAGLMAGHHRDPFDRLLAAQAQVEGLVLVTNDGKLAELGVEVVW